MEMELISAYSRTEALNDGVLSDLFINACAQEVGIKWHCACTSSLHAELFKAGNDSDAYFYDLVFLFRTMILNPMKNQNKSLTLGATFFITMKVKNRNKKVKIIFNEELMNDQIQPCWTFLNVGED